MHKALMANTQGNLKLALLGQVGLDNAQLGHLDLDKALVEITQGNSNITNEVAKHMIYKKPMISQLKDIGPTS